jgi:HK97 family phage prohead protease
MNMASRSIRPEPVEGCLAATGASTSSARTERKNTLRFAGYAAIFNRIDKGGDIIRPGAFGGLVEGKSLPLLWQHDPMQRIGQVDYVREDRRGLRVIGSLSTLTRAGRDAAVGLASGAMKGLSFGYRVNRSSGQKPRQLLDLEVAEVSLVTFPMQQLARVHRVEGQADLS